MPRSYSLDLRARVIGQVESGESRRAAADHYEISPSAAVKWVKRFRETGSYAAMARGGSVSPLEAHGETLLRLVAEQPDLTLDETVAAIHKRGIAGSRSAVWRFYRRHEITFKKKPARGRAGAPRRGVCAAALEARAGPARSAAAGVSR